MAACRAGDTLVVTKLDRLARSLPDARAIVEELTCRQVKLSLCGEGPAGPRIGPNGTRDRTERIPVSRSWTRNLARVVRSAEDLPNPAVVVVNPEDDVTPEAFIAWLDQLQ